ncbi:MAG: hypothetical protein ACKOOH_04555, partial [Cyanobium sp.]
MPRARGGSPATNGSKAAAGAPSSISAGPDGLSPRLEDVIRVRGARQHNLRNVDLTIPRNRLVVF